MGQKTRLTATFEGIIGAILIVNAPILVAGIIEGQVSADDVISWIWLVILIASLAVGGIILVGHAKSKN